MVIRGTKLSAWFSKAFDCRILCCTGFSLCLVSNMHTIVTRAPIFGHSQVTEEESEFVPYDPSQEPIFPSELQVTQMLYTQRRIEPYYLLLGLLNANLKVGNTGKILALLKLFGHT